MSWTEFSNKRLRSLLENMVAEGALAERFGIAASASQIVDASSDDLLDVIRTSLPLSQLMDTSDLVLHAEGPGVRDHHLRLSSVNWLTSTAEAAIRKLSGSLFQIANRDAKRLGRALDLRLTGLAPGSLYVGLAVEEGPEDLASGSESIVQTIKSAVRLLPTVTSYIDDESINAAVREILPDPAQRDSALAALYRLSPTGRRGVHTLDLASPGTKSATLSQRERVVLKDAIDRPQLSNRHRGSFVGALREIDLDARRFHLRNVAGIGVLRCVVGDFESIRAKEVIGEFVRVTGDFETDRDGKPRLMVVQRIEVLAKADQPNLPQV